MTREQALQIVDRTLAGISLSRADHATLIEAIRVLKEPKIEREESNA